MQNLGIQNIEMLGALRAIVSDLTDQCYQSPRAKIYDSSVGSHVCRIVSTHQAIVQGIYQHQIDYEREAFGIAHCTRIEAIEHIDNLIFALNHISEDVKVDVIAADKLELFSSIGRELWFALDQGKNHLALIGYALELHADTLCVPENKVSGTLKKTAA